MESFELGYVFREKEIELLSTINDELNSLIIPAEIKSIHAFLEMISFSVVSKADH